MIKYKNLCGYSLSMKTKDLTRDEAREAIKILALKEDNLKNIVTSVTILLVAVVALFTPIIIALNQNFPDSFSLDFLYLIMMAAVIISIFIFILPRIINSKSKGAEEKMKKLAKEHNLEEFLDAISDRK